MDAEYRIHTLEPAIYTGFAGRYRVPRIESSDVGWDAASVRAVFGQNPENITIRPGLPYLLEML